MKTNFKGNKVSLILLSSILVLSIVALTVYRQPILEYYNDNYVPVKIMVGRKGDSRVKLASHETRKIAISMVRFIWDCKIIPKNYQDVIERTTEGMPYRGAPEHFKSERKKANVDYCTRFPFQPWEDDLLDKNNKELAYPWIDPWGRPYQVRYNYEFGKLQVRSQGRALESESDDIIEETFFNGKDYKDQVEFCKTVPKDDMSCIFNRGWH